MSNPEEILKRLKQGDSKDLTVQLGKDGDIIADPTGYISTGNPMLDYLIGRPGIPLGGITVLAGTTGTGKSTICLKIIKECQAAGGQAVYYDTEGRMNFPRAEKLGVDIDNLIIAQPDSLEELFEGVKNTIKATRATLEEDSQVVIVIDSIAGVPLEQDIDGKGGPIARFAFLLRKELRIMTSLVNRQRIALVIVTQPRATIEFGRLGKPPANWMGKEPLGHAAMTTLWLDVWGKFPGPDGDENSPIGHRIQAVLKDTRIAGCTVPECKECRRKDFRRTFDFYDATGPDFFGSALDVLKEKGLITSSGGWYQFKEEEKKFRRSEWEEKFLQPDVTAALSDILKGPQHDEPNSE